MPVARSMAGATFGPKFLVMGVISSMTTVTITWGALELASDVTVDAGSDSMSALQWKEGCVIERLHPPAVVAGQAIVTKGGLMIGHKSRLSLDVTLGTNSQVEIIATT